MRHYVRPDAPAGQILSVLLPLVGGVIVYALLPAGGPPHRRLRAGFFHPAERPRPDELTLRLTAGWIDRWL
jgi:hypothetical protein